MEYTEKQKEQRRKAVYNYDQNFERVNCRFEKGTKERIESLKAESIARFIQYAVYKELEEREKLLKIGTKKVEKKS